MLKFVLFTYSLLSFFLIVIKHYLKIRRAWLMGVAVTPTNLEMDSILLLTSEEWILSHLYFKECKN